MKEILARRLSQDDIMEICSLTQGKRNDGMKERLYKLTLDENRRVATNALWAFTHFALADNEWLYGKHDDLIDRCLTESDNTKLRLMLALLLRQPFEEEGVRTDFIDFCLNHLADAKWPYAVRAQCMKLAYRQMCHWPELLGELQRTLDLVSREPLAPRLRSEWKQVRGKIG